MGGGGVGGASPGLETRKHPYMDRGEMEVNSIYISSNKYWLYTDTEYITEFMLR